MVIIDLCMIFLLVHVFLNPTVRTLFIVYTVLIGWFSKISGSVITSCPIINLEVLPPPAPLLTWKCYHLPIINLEVLSPPPPLLTWKCCHLLPHY